ncbi:uncharacterized protein [Henckelia pumila]|uniref:uncharacterized protein n=1 Tax=Henckelia pumila TaxID=405737 RepID=UPI003C6E107F
MSSGGDLVARCCYRQNWFPPSRGQLRLDVDAGFDETNNRFSIGVVVRDYRGRVKWAKARAIRNPGSVKGAEITAIWFGLEFCMENDFSNVRVYSDSIQAIIAVNSPGEERGTKGAIALDVKDFLNGPKFLSVSHMRRTANLVAHKLAHLALSSDFSLDLSNSILPSWLDSLVSCDFNI